MQFYKAIVSTIFLASSVVGLPAAEVVAATPVKIPGDYGSTHPPRDLEAGAKPHARDIVAATPHTTPPAKPNPTPAARRRDAVIAARQEDPGTKTKPKRRDIAAAAAAPHEPSPIPSKPPVLRRDDEVRNEVRDGILGPHTEPETKTAPAKRRDVAAATPHQPSPTQGKPPGRRDAVAVAEADADADALKEAAAVAQPPPRPSPAPSKPPVVGREAGAEAQAAAAGLAEAGFAPRAGHGRRDAIDAAAGEIL